MPRKKNGPGPEPEAIPTNTTTAGTTRTACVQGTRLHRPEDGYAAPTDEDRLDAAVIAAAKARGFTVAVRCTRCSQWVVTAASVAAHMGPVCRAKTAAEVTR